MEIYETLPKATQQLAAASVHHLSGVIRANRLALFKSPSGGGLTKMGSVTF